MAFFLSPFIILSLGMGLLLYPILQVVAIVRARELRRSLGPAVGPLIPVGLTAMLVGLNRFIQTPEINSWTIYLVIIVPIVVTIYLFFYVVCAAGEA